MARDLNRSIKIYIDNSDAMKKTKDLETRMASLRQKLADLDAQGKKGSPEYARTEKALQQLSASYARYQEKLKETERILKNLSGATEQELLMVRNQLRNDLKKTTRDTDEYRAKLKALLAVERELAIVEKEKNSAMGRNGSMWSRMADGFNKYFGVVTSIIAGITGLSFTLRKLSEDVAKMDDVYSDVMKTTGMTRDDVLDLNETFKKMDTQTAREELNNLARDAGKLGLEGSKDILDFVEAGNQINVALGEDLGEGAIKNIGKMTDVYKLSTKELEQLDLKGKMLAIGSAINELGASSTASERYLVNFAQRLGGVASQAGISIQDILGYASALDQSGQAVEMSATAMQKFIMKLMSEPSKFAKLAGLEVKAFNELLQKDTNSAIKQVLAALADKGGFQALIPVFKDMGLDGARAVGVLSALATNIEKVNVAQEVSNKAFSDGTSITDEYSIKNNNLNAQLEKARKNFKDASLELGESLNPVLLTSTKWTTYLIKALPTVLDFFEKYGKYLLYLTVVYGLYVAGVKVAAGVESVYNGILAIGRLRRIQVALATTQSAAAQTLYNNVLQNGSIVTRAYTAVTSLLSAAKFLLTGNLTKARQAMLAFNTAVSLNPAGLAATVVLALVAAIGYLIYKSSQVVTAQKAVESATKDLNDELAREQSQANKLFEALKRTNPESDEHRKIKDKIIQLYGPYLKGLVDEKGNLIDIAKAQETVNTKIRENIALKIKQAATDKLQEERIKNQLSDVDKVMERVDVQLKKSQEGYTTETSNAIREKLNKAIDSAIADGQADIVNLTAKIKETLKSEGVNTRDAFWTFGNGRTTIDMYINSLASGIHVTQREIQKVEDQFKGMISEATELNSILGDDDNNDDGYTPPGDDPDNKLATKQKKELDLILENLEIAHQNRLSDIKRKYESGEIKSKSDFDTQIFGQNQAYYILQERALTDYLKKVSDKTLRSDISKQIADIQNKQLDETLKRREKIEQILLDADPERKEKIAYENRLRESGLFGVEREKLTADQLKALELLEQQHNDNLVRIRKDRKKKDKATAEEQFEEEFADRKAQLQQEIADEEQKLTVATGIGSLSGEDQFNAEVELQRKRIALIQEEVAAREKAGLDTKAIMKKYRTEELNLTQLYVNEFKRRSQLYGQYADNLGSALGNVLIGQENALQGFASVVLDILFDTLSSIINAKIAEATAVAIAEQAKAAAISAAQPDSVISFGATAVARTAAIGAIIMGALAAAKTALKGLLTNKSSSSSSPSSSGGSGERVYDQRAAGKYDVIGAEDGKLYRDLPYGGLAPTGIVGRPTIYGEQGAELVVSSPDFKALQKHVNYPFIVQAINDVRSGSLPQRATGKYDQLPASENEEPKPEQDSGLINLLLPVLNRLIIAIEILSNKEFDINYYKFEKAKKVVDSARSGASKRK